MVFAEKKQDVDAIHEYLLLKGVEAAAIHGGKGKYGCVSNRILQNVKSLGIRLQSIPTTGPQLKMGNAFPNCFQAKMVR